jgi:RimJ/RimL family protein N-acetyltransferase
VSEGRLAAAGTAVDCLTLEPVGATENLEVYPLTEEHAAGLVDAIADPSVRAFVINEPSTLEAMRERIAFVAAGPPDSRPGEVWLDYTFVQDGRPIGRIEATVQNGIAEIAYVIGPAYGGRGLATEAVAWLIDHLRTRWPGNDIYACIAEGNTRSRRLVERLGFALTSPNGVPLRSFDEGDVVYRLQDM